MLPKEAFVTKKRKYETEELYAKISFYRNGIKADALKLHILSDLFDLHTANKEIHPSYSDNQCIYKLISLFDVVL